MADGLPILPQIDHRSTLYHYTQKVSHIEECTYTQDQMDHFQSTIGIDPCNTITPNNFHIKKNAHIPMADEPPLPTKDPCYTITPNKFHI